ncbi:MAG: SRPBCC family protein [Bacteroidota bacterium]
MATTQVTRIIHAAPAIVFDTIAHGDSFAKASHDIVGVEYLTEQRRGAGTRFRETRQMGSRRASTVLEVREYLPDERVRFVTDAGGTIWDSTFVLSPEGASTRLDLTMEDRPHRLLSRIMGPMIRNMVRSAMERDMEAVKLYCERHSERS